MSIAKINQNGRYTYKDYLTWPEEENWELIDGTPYMQAAPSWQHQAIIGNIITQFNNYLQGKSCFAFPAPFDLRLPEGNEIDEDVTTVLQPDIAIVCDKNRLSKTGYNGVPSLVVEVVSPSTSKMDRLFKFNKYEKAGVKEYWIVEPDGKVVSVFTLQSNNRYGRPETYTEEHKVEISILPDFIVDLSQVFATI